MAVEKRFAAAVQRRWNDKPALHCDLDQFHVGRIQIPETVARKQLAGCLAPNTRTSCLFLVPAGHEHLRGIYNLSG
jgi:hypothetical protein